MAKSLPGQDKFYDLLGNHKKNIFGGDIEKEKAKRMSTGPSQGFLSKVFGKKKMSGVKSGSSTDSPEVERGYRNNDKPKEKKPQSLLAKASATKKKYNPFDRFVSATNKR